jgi:hypothetical protein
LKRSHISVPNNTQSPFGCPVFTAVSLIFLLFINLVFG